MSLGIYIHLTVWKHITKKKNTYNSIDSAYFTEYQCILDHLFRSIQQSFAKNGSQARHSYSFDPVTIVRFFFVRSHVSTASLFALRLCVSVVCVTVSVYCMCVCDSVCVLCHTFQATTVPTAQKLKRITAACANHSLFFGIEIMKSNC